MQAPGTITIAVTDFQSCFAQATINVTQPVLRPGTIAANQVLCSGDNPAQLTETVPEPVARVHITTSGSMVQQLLAVHKIIARSKRNTL